MNALDLIVKRVVDGFHPLRIVLFGSVARGEQGRDSDVDLLVVMPDGVSRLDTAGDLQMAMFGVPLSVDFLVATPSDLERHRDNIGLIYHSILKEGKVLYAAAFRYPGELDDVGVPEHKYRQALRLARGVFDWAAHIIGDG